MEGPPLLNEMSSAQLQSQATRCVTGRSMPLACDVRVLPTVYGNIHTTRGQPSQVAKQTP